MGSLDGLQMFLQEIDKGQQRLNEAVQSVNMEKEKQFGRKLQLLEHGLDMDDGGNLKEIPFEKNPLFQQQIKQKAAFDPNLLIGKNGELIVDPDSELGQQMRIKQGTYELGQQATQLEIQGKIYENALRNEVDPLKVEEAKTALEINKLQLEHTKKMLPLQEEKAKQDVETSKARQKLLEASASAKMGLIDPSTGKLKPKNEADLRRLVLSSSNLFDRYAIEKDNPSIPQDAKDALLKAAIDDLKLYSEYRAGSSESNVDVVKADESKATTPASEPEKVKTLEAVKMSPEVERAKKMVKELSKKHDKEAIVAKLFEGGFTEEEVKQIFGE